MLFSRYLLPFTICILLCQISCSEKDQRTGTLEARIRYQDSVIASLNDKIENLRPGLGEIMSIIQQHHAKLWFAGTNENWELASFEMDEIREQLVVAKELANRRPEVSKIPMLFPPLDSISLAIQKQDVSLFRTQFTYLTNTCNDCHNANNFGFNVITIPTAPPVSNQDFRK